MSKPDLNEMLSGTLKWCKDRDYAGHSKHDALNSPLLETLSFNNKFIRLVYTQVLMRLPVNLRGLCGVPRLRNPKGIGLFAHALLDRAASGADDAEACIAEAETLLTWLIDNGSPWAPASDGLYQQFDTSPNTDAERKLAGLGWGYHYPWQDAGFFQPRHFPNRVVTSWIGFAFIRAYEVTQNERYLNAAEEAVTFLLDNPKRIVDTPEELCLSYVPLEDIEVAVMDVSVLSAALCAWVARYRPERSELRDIAIRLTLFVVNKQTDYGAWFYTWPSKDSHITHDNYHTGIIIDCIADVMRALDDDCFMDCYKRGLVHYRDDLFTKEGAPKWMNDKTTPHDIHGASAGILCFTRAAQMLKDDQWLAEADKVMQWTTDTLYSGNNFFYYQKTAFFVKRFCLMRWCNAWMCRAMAQMQVVRNGFEG